MSMMTTTQQQTTLSNLRRMPVVSGNPPETRAGFETVAGFELMQRAAKMFAQSDLVPPQYKGNIANCTIAMDMAMRIGANPLMVMQNLYLVYNRPAWSAKFLIATINKCGRFSALRYEFQGKEGQDNWGCRAVATELSTGEKLEGPLITIGLAKKEGWYAKRGSKWQSIPELMLRYRAASWFVSAYAPELAMGLQTVEESSDTYDLEQSEDGSYAITTEEIKAEVKREKEQETEAIPAASSPKKEKSAPEKKKSQDKPEPNNIPPSENTAGKDDGETKSVMCPKQNNQWVSEDDCWYCESKCELYTPPAG